MKQTPNKCSVCKASEIQCVDAGLVNNNEYRETFECLVCGKQWDNIYRYAKTKKKRVEEC